MNRMYKFAAILLFAGFLVAVSYLMVLRFERGDVYPAYSSLRSDPLGTRAFYDSLESLKGIHVTRNLRPVTSLDQGKDSTLLFVGADLRGANTVPQEEARALDHFMTTGGRVVVTLMPVVARSGDQRNESEKRNPETDSQSRNRQQTKNKDSKSDGDGTDKANDISDADELLQEEYAGDDSYEKPVYTTLKAQWGIVIGTDPEADDDSSTDNTGYAASRNVKLPRVQSWHSSVYISELSDAWDIIYTNGGEAVMAERGVGEGSLVVSTDSYFMSNEALKSDRYPELLLFLIGGNRFVIVDETHHGIQRVPGMIGYLRQYQLHWVLVALLTVAALFVWRNAIPLVPPEQRHADDASKAVQTRNATQGMTQLLRRNINPQKLLSVCFEQWEKAFEKNFRFPHNRRERARRIIEPSGASSGVKPDPVNGFQAISRILLEDQPNE